MLKFPHGGDIYRHPDVVDFSANINPLGPPPGVLLALGKSAGQISNYPDVSCGALREKISGKEQVPEDYILCGNGAADLIFSLVLAKNPRNALLLSPTFLEYEQALKTVDCSINYFDLKREEGFSVTEELLGEITGELDIMFLCNPNNPTGALISNSLLQKIADQCQNLNILLVLDECFIDFTDNPGENSRKPLLKDYPNLFILKAFTKLYAMPGIRLGYGLCSNGCLLEKMTRMTQPWNVSVPAQTAGIAALKEEAYVKDSLDLIRGERNWLVTQLTALSYQVLPPSANYIFFHGAAGLAEYLLKNGILIRDCSNYRSLIPGDYRIAVRLPEENRKLVHRLSQC